MEKLNVMSEIEKSMANMRSLTDELNKQVQSNWSNLASIFSGQDNAVAKPASTPKPRIKKTAKKQTKPLAQVVEQNTTTIVDSSSVQTELADDAELNTAPKTDITPTIPALS